MTRHLAILSLAAALAGFGFGPALAQSSSGTSTDQSGVATGSKSGGVTSGPASPSAHPATLGTGGVTATTPGERDVLHSHGGKAITAERRGQKGGTRSSIRPGKTGAESGVAHKAKSAKK